MDDFADKLMWVSGATLAVGFLYVITAAWLGPASFGDFGAVLVFFGMILGIIPAIRKIIDNQSGGR